ncbi:MAG: hypothetical protein AB7O97_02160 [Planctomycetota bacterium]
MAVPSRSVELTARGKVMLALAAASLLGALLSGDGNVRLAAGLLLAPLIVDFARTPRRLDRAVLQVQPRRTVVGAPFHEVVQVHNGGRAPLREVLVREPRTRGAPALLPTVPAQGHARAVLACTSLERSHCVERVFELATEWPLGLFRSSAVVVLTADMVTEPRRVALAPALVHAAAEQLPAPDTRSHLAGDEFHALREHHPHEDARGVHAQRSAALGSLVRTVLRGRLPRDVAIVVDLRRPPGRMLHRGARRFEWSLGACATLLDLLRAGDCTVHAWVLASTSERHVVRRDGEHRELLTALAECQPILHRELDRSALAELRRMDQCFWVPAGGYLERAELDALHVRVRIVGGERG